MPKLWMSGALGAALIALAAATPASAQVKPTVMETGVESPASAIYIAADEIARKS